MLLKSKHIYAIYKEKLIRENWGLKNCVHFVYTPQVSTKKSPFYVILQRWDFIQVPSSAVKKERLRRVRVWLFFICEIISLNVISFWIDKSYPIINFAFMIGYSIEMGVLFVILIVEIFLLRGKGVSFCLINKNMWDMLSDKEKETNLVSFFYITLPDKQSDSAG